MDAAQGTKSLTCVPLPWCTSQSKIRTCVATPTKVKCQWCPDAAVQHNGSRAGRALGGLQPANLLTCYKQTCEPATCACPPLQATPMPALFNTTGGACKQTHHAWGALRLPTFCRPCARCAWRAASAALFSRQKPICSTAVAWCPGGRQIEKALAASGCWLPPALPLLLPALPPPTPPLPLLLPAGPLLLATRASISATAVQAALRASV